MKTKSLLIAGATILAILATKSAAAVVTGTYSFGADGHVETFAYNGAAITGVTVGNLVKVGVTSSSSSGNSRASNWPTGATTESNAFTGTIDPSKYFVFTLAALGGYTLDMSSITFGVGRSTTGPRQWEWRSSANNYASAIETYTSTTAGLTLVSGVLTNPDTNSSWTGNVLDLSAEAYKDLTNISFRIYGYNSESTVGTGGLQGDLNFDVTAVPEPTAVFLGAFGLLGLLRRRR
ncbi:MAG: PEP-CTERM sorting domain-containing protein [Akkermansiaceae bacterium]